MKVSVFLIATAFILVQTFDIKNLISTPNSEGKLDNLLRFIKAISPKPSLNSNNVIHEQENQNMENQEWLMDHLASRRDLVRILKTVYKMIAFKKITKFFLILGFLFFIPVMNTNNISESVIDLNNDRDFDPFAFVNKTDYRSIERLNFFMHALEGFSNPVVVWCVAGYDIFCRFQFMFDTIDQIYTFDQVVHRFLPNGAEAKLMSMINYIRPRIESTFVGIKKDFFAVNEDDYEENNNSNDDDDE